MANRLSRAGPIKAPDLDDVRAVLLSVVVLKRVFCARLEACLSADRDLLLKPQQPAEVTFST